MVSQIGNEMKDGNVRLSMKGKGQYSRIGFSANITWILIVSYLDPEMILLHPFSEHSCFILF